MAHRDNVGTSDWALCGPTATPDALSDLDPEIGQLLRGEARSEHALDPVAALSSAHALAMRIEALWHAGRLGYAEVIAAFRTLERRVARAEHALAPRVSDPPRGHALVAAAPGEQHTLGASVVSALLARDGWSVSRHPTGAAETLMATAGAMRYDLIGLSVGHDDALFGLGDLISGLRARCPGALVVLGGSVFASGQAGFDFLGVDLVAGAAGPVLDHLRGGRMLDAGELQ